MAVDGVPLAAPAPWAVLELLAVKPMARPLAGMVLLVAQVASGAVAAVAAAGPEGWPRSAPWPG